MGRSLILLSFVRKVGQKRAAMKKTFLLIAPLSMLALAACNKTETPAADPAADANAAATTAAATPMPPAITAQNTYRCSDSTILYVDFLGANEAADIHVGDKMAAAVRVTAPVAPAPAAGAPPADPAAAKPAGPMKSTDGQTSLSGSGKQINVKLAGKSAQTCKG
jgi:hypothetical protein